MSEPGESFAGVTAIRRVFAWLGAFLWFATATPALAAGVVTNNTTSALLTALQGGGLVQLNLSSPLVLEVPIVVGADTVLIGATNAGRTAVLSGGGALRLFRVLPGIRLEVRDVELREGLSTNGGAILNEGVLVASNVVFTSCQAAGPDGAAGADGSVRFGFGDDGRDGNSGTPAAGGAVFSTGEATFLNCTFNVNEANGGAGGPGGKGGDGSSHVGHGGNGGHGATAQGGAISSSGRLVINNTLFTGNASRGGDGGDGGSNGSVEGAGQGGAGATGAGGAVHSSGWLLLTQSSFTTNLVVGGDAAAAGAPFKNVGYDGYAGGNAFGGALASWSTGMVVNTTFYTNLMAAGNGGDGAAGTFTSGEGGDGGSALGAAMHARGLLAVTNVTFGWNTGTNGAGGVAGGSFRSDDGHPGNTRGSAIAADNGASVSVVNSIFAATGITTLTGTVLDLGHNIFTDNGTGSRGPGSLWQTDPLLSAFQVWTSGLPGFLPLSGSPATDTADPASMPPVDQRGLSRPSGLGPDIGAMEVGVSTYVIRGNVLHGSDGLAGVKVFVGTNAVVTGADGAFHFGPYPQGFYTVELENDGVGFTPRLIQLALNADATNLVFRTVAQALTLALSRNVASGTDSLIGTGGLPAGLYRLDGSADLTSWTELQSVTADSQGRVQATYQSGPRVSWYYRVVAP